MTWLRSMFSNRSALGLMALAIVVACGSSDSDSSSVAPDCTLPGPTVIPSHANLHPGDTLTATVQPPPCTPACMVRWTSSDTAVAVVDLNRGQIRAVAKGIATVTASAVLDPSVKGALVVNVSP